MAPKKSGKKASARAKLAEHKKDLSALAAKMKQLKKVDDQRRKLQLDIVRLEVQMMSRQVPGLCPTF